MPEWIQWALNIGYLAASLVTLVSGVSVFSYWVVGDQPSRGETRFAVASLLITIVLGVIVWTIFLTGNRTILS